MAVKLSAELLGEAFERARADWRRRRPDENFEVAPAQPVAAAFTIAISRERGAGGSEVAREIGKQLGWAVYDRELLERIAEEAGLRAELLRSIDEKRSHWLVELLETFGRASTMSGCAYVRHVAETMLALALHGECVIVGRGGTAVLPPETTLRVRVVAPVEDRVKRLARELGVSEAKAAHDIQKIDADRAAFVKGYFHQDLTDEHHYDLTINTSRMSVEEAAGIVIDALRRRQKGSREANKRERPAASGKTAS